eukprot:CAMPEP_0172772580 /NCGR_PEP_ID=MMETSP1074-20121228/192659_1 /TAXON_ID=2916 /ORGANISM="Ceratium fusus, Strain PA161109" /LENGTH=55 /DNA_ID=CAMNT_0013608725 /DNA_START=1 /DNA_END=164 /DNA_ORIENTATION=-
MRGDLENLSSSHAGSRRESVHKNGEDEFIDPSKLLLHAVEFATPIRQTVLGKLAG